MPKNLSITKRDKDRFGVAFQASEGRLTCEVSVARQNGASDRRTLHEKEKEVREKLKRLAQELSAALDSPEQGS